MLVIGSSVGRMKRKEGWEECMRKVKFERGSEGERMGVMYV